jgi:hypothetical protein
MSWIQQFFQMDQFYNPQPTARPSSAYRRPQVYIPSYGSFAARQASLASATRPTPTRPSPTGTSSSFVIDEPPPSYTEAFPQGPPEHVLRQITNEQPQQSVNLSEPPPPVRPRIRQEQRHHEQHTFTTPQVQFAEHNLGVDRDQFQTIKIETYGAPYIYVLLPRQPVYQLPMYQRPSTLQTTQSQETSFSTFSVRNESSQRGSADGASDTSEPVPSMADTAQTRRVRFEIGRDADTDHTYVMRHGAI